MGLITPHVKMQFFTKYYAGLRNLTDFWKDVSKKKMHITFDRWYIRSLYRTGSLTTVARETAKYK
jgi:hypothetical protein